MSTPRHGLAIGDLIEVIDPYNYPPVVRGKILELDTHPLEYGVAKIEIYSAAMPAPIKWVSLRNARKVG